MTLRVDFTSQDFFREPAAAIKRLRAAGPVVEARLPIFGRVLDDDHARDGFPRTERQSGIHFA